MDNLRTGKELLVAVWVFMQCSYMVANRCETALAPANTARSYFSVR